MSNRVYIISTSVIILLFLDYLTLIYFLLIRLFLVFTCKSSSKLANFSISMPHYFCTYLIN